MKKIKKVNNHKRLTSILTTDFRKLVTEKLGKLSTPDSFMYFFRRFGAPNQTNEDDYKILYNYLFEYKDLIISIHASYYEYVYFNLLINKSYLKIFYKERVQLCRKMAKHSHSRNIAYMPYSCIFYPEKKELTKLQNEQYWKIINYEAERYYSKEALAFIEGQLKSENPDHKIFDLLRPFESYLCDKFRKSLPQDDKFWFSGTNDRLWLPMLKDVPKIRKQCLGFIQELKRGVYVRDVLINIKGYGSEENKISRVLKQNI